MGVSYTALFKFHVYSIIFILKYLNNKSIEQLPCVRFRVGYFICGLLLYSHNIPISGLYCADFSDEKAIA